MSRRRYISTEISVDKRINQLSDFAALLYTWMIPHADDDGIITSDLEELSWIVMPGRRRKSAQITAAINDMLDAGLVIDAGDGKLYFPYESFYRYQTYIPPAKRRGSDPDAGERRETPKNTVSPSPSPSPSPIPSLSKTDLDGEFDRFWKLYPRKAKKGDARKAWAVAIAKADPEAIITGLEHNLPALKANEPKFIPHPTTWLNDERWTDELVSPTPSDIPTWSSDDFADFFTGAGA